MRLFQPQHPLRQVGLLAALLLLCIVPLVLFSLRLNPTDPSSLPFLGVDCAILGKGAFPLPSCAFLDKDRPQLVVISQGSDRTHIDAHNQDGRVDFTAHGIDPRLWFGTMHEQAEDLDGDLRADLLYSAHYRGGQLASSDAADVDSVVVGFFSADRALKPFWTLKRPLECRDDVAWNVEIALPEFRTPGHGSTRFAINVSGRGRWTSHKNVGLFLKGRPPRLIRELELGVTANAMAELPGEPPQVALGGRAPWQGGQARLSWTRSDGRDTTLVIHDNQGSAFLLDAEGALCWAATFGQGAGATLVQVLGEKRDTLLCTFIEQAFTAPGEPRRSTRLWLERAGGRGLDSDTLHGLYRPFIGPALQDAVWLGLLGDSLSTRLVGARPGEFRLLRDLRLADNDFPIPLVQVGGEPAFALADGANQVSLFHFSGRRQAILNGGEPTLPARYATGGRVQDRLLVLDGPQYHLAAVVGKGDPGWFFWRLRWPLSIAATLLAIFALMTHQVLARARRLRHLAEQDARLETQQGREARHLLSLNQQLDEIILKLKDELKAQNLATSTLRDKTSFLVEIIDSHGDAILVVDGDDTVLQLNRTFASLFGVERDSCAGRPLAACGVELLRDFDHRLRQGTLPVDGGYYIYKSQAPNGTFRVHLNRLERKNGHAKLMMVSIRNITSLIEIKKDTSAPRRHKEIVGESLALRELLQQVEEARDNLSNVLILGESGTGKELIADALHRSSKVAQGPLVKFNCAALPGGLLESELFGHVRGAFTGASADRVGRFEAAQGGTLFMDEIGDMDLVTQSKLLRVLESGEFQRLGETATRKASVRVVAATHQDLERKLERGEFRHDLYYRLNVLVLKVPALRERRDDIPLLVDRFVRHYADAMTRPLRGIDEEALAILRAYNWPGNVRELRNVVERAVLSCHGDMLQAAHLPQELLTRVAVRAPGVLAAGSEAGGRTASVTRRQLMHALGANAWNMSNSARQLGISRSSLYNHLRELGIRRPRGNVPDRAG